jgi:glycogen debranching enzyme
VGAILADRGGEAGLREELARRAERVEAGLERFWLPDEGCPAMALMREKQPIPMVASNIGHALWCGALTGARAAEAGARLMRPDLLTDWGLRTLSAANYAFDPSSYHCGSVWPFDNAIAASALWRMGWHDDARAIGRRVLAAIEAFGSPVELYCVLPGAWVTAPAAGGDVLYDYVEATRVQAWTAAAVLLFAAQIAAAPLAT